MKDRGGDLTRKDILFVNQLIDSLEEASEKLEEAYRKKDHEAFHKTRKFMLEIQKKVYEVVNEF